MDHRTWRRTCVHIVKSASYHRYTLVRFIPSVVASLCEEVLKACCVVAAKGVRVAPRRDEETGRDRATAARVRDGADMVAGRVGNASMLLLYGKSRWVVVACPIRAIVMTANAPNLGIHQLN